MIHILDNFLSSEEIDYCKKLIFENECSFIQNSRRVHMIEEIFYEDETLKSIKQRLNYQANKLISNIKIDWSEFVYREKNTLQNFHVDDYSKSIILSSIIYLNDDFRGGETIFQDGTVVSPVPGKVVFFDGNKIIHGVNIVNTGYRITLATWYKTKG
jgi:predicted 2-oxoglutarate/Fe(II)-dependent dioxygenase YbiX